ncbi:MAG: helix-turn-helix transcriptional regulator, partial [Pseudomonadales bacterium]|nr:helix-turn-helix transcriptional regulator [Pseudomonadales bacterium]
QGYIRMYIDDADALLPIFQLFVKGEYENRRIGFVKKIIRKIPKKPISDTLLEKLTAKEIEIVKLLQQGMQNRKIAEILCVSEGTLKWHLHNVYTKFMVKNRVQALLKAKEYGYL